MAYNCWDTKWKRGFWRGIEIIGFTAGVALIPFSIFIWLNIWLWPNFMHDLIREIPESWIEDVSEWQGPFTFNSEQNFPLQIEVAIMEATGKETISGVKYEKRTGKATYTPYLVEFTEIRLVPDRNYKGEYPPKRWFVYSQSKATGKVFSFLVLITINLAILISLFWASWRIHKRLKRESLPLPPA
ncbi:MAG TPA: hypothetical protein PKH31_02330 [Candidatus Sumerlaeota bacterium]|nr:hypothetical protein [Candidatus Sumerlaeota bacterium]